MTTPTTTPAPAAQAEGAARTCQCCPRRLTRSEIRSNRRVCWPCEGRLTDELTEVETLWRELPRLLNKGTGGEVSDAPRAPGPSGSQAPCRLNVLSLLGGGVTEPLLVEEDAWRTELRKTRHCPLTPHRGGQDTTLKGTVAWLRVNLRWACEAYPDVDDLNRTLGRLLGELRGLVTGDQRRREDLTPGCPRPARGYDDNDPAAPTCGGQLTHDPRKSVIRCDTCRRSYNPLEWVALGAAAGVISLPFTIPA
ncbi:MAG: hypothetical protein HOY79_33585 [Streptomyces sp.]|nr:hypothetical protein [Streptomyces sp.]NUS11374.1 hypothetical protein [Streptomyces sp.]NUS23485.1 hypothetical protein [Streptomyces sp.]